MSPPDAAGVVQLLNQEPFRILSGGKQLTLAFGGFYIASTTLISKPKLVWETQNGAPRYYVPIESLHKEIRVFLTGSSTEPYPRIQLETVDTITGNGNASKAAIERLTVGSKVTTWVRFLEGPLKGFVRFERDEIGKSTVSF